MSVELTVKIKNLEIEYISFFSILTDYLKSHFNFSSTGVNVTSSPSPENLRLGGSESAVNMGIEGHSKIHILCHFAGTEADLGDEGGWWVYLSVRERTPQSFLLMLVTTAILAEIASSTIVDESHILHQNTNILPSDIFEVLNSTKKMNFRRRQLSLRKNFLREFRYAIEIRHLLSIQLVSVQSDCL